MLWVQVALVISTLLYIACRWRHLRPDAEKPATPAASLAPATSPAPAASPAPAGSPVPG